MLSIFDFQSGTKKPFTPLDPTQVKVYVCGMTVYDHCHLGHARSAVFFDVAVKHLRRIYGTQQVHFARNVTDVDDKIIARAALNHEPIHSLTQRMIASMHDDLAALGCAAPDFEPRATAHIADMIELVQVLVDRKMAYVASDGEVLFDSTRAPRFGSISGQKTEGLAPGVRIAGNLNKRNPMDFVLWKPAKPEEQAWPSPWGEGRPGWHLECSAMIHHLFGPQIDLHGGGEDLKFPHHECENAQSECAWGKPLSGQWIHNGFVLSNGLRMGKSMGNAFTIKDILALADGEAARVWILSGHYRQPIDFSIEALQAAQTRLERLYALRAQAETVLSEAGLVMDPAAANPEVLARLDDDFDTPGALAVAEKQAKGFRVQADPTSAQRFLSSFAPLGLLLRSHHQFVQDQARRTPDLPPEVLQLARDRQLARLTKDWDRSDALRLKIVEAGWLIRDKGGDFELVAAPSLQGIVPADSTKELKPSTVDSISRTIFSPPKR